MENPKEELVEETRKHIPLLLVDVIDFYGVKILGGVLFTNDGYAYNRHEVILSKYEGMDNALKAIQEVKDKWSTGVMEVWVRNPRLWKKLFGNPDFDVRLKHFSDLDAVKTMVFSYEDGLADIYGINNKPPKAKKKHSFIRALMINACAWALQKLDKE